MFPKYSGALGYPVFTNVPMILHSKLKSMRRCHHFREDPDGHAENRQSHDPEEFLCHHGTDRPPHSKINATGVCHEVMGCCFNKTIGSESPAQLPLARRFRLADGPCGVTLFCTACGFFRLGIMRQKMELSGVGRLASRFFRYTTFMKEPKELQCLPLTLGFRWMLPVIPRNWIQPCIVYKWLMRCILYATATDTKHHKTIWFSHTSPFLLPLISTKSTCWAHLSSTTSPIMSIPVQCQINKESQICIVSDQSPRIYIYIFRCHVQMDRWHHSTPGGCYTLCECHPNLDVNWACFLILKPIFVGRSPN